MTFLDILNDDLTNLPITTAQNRDFRQELESKINKFAKLIDEGSGFTNSNFDGSYSEETFKKINRIVRDSVLDCINEYLLGRTHKAYLILAKTMEILLHYMSPLQYVENTSFFRLRVMDSNYPLSKEELFHIPFEERGKVSSRRYSIPGLPSLYLSNSIYTAWEEMQRPSFKQIQSVLLKNTSFLIFLDLTTTDYINGRYKDNDNHGWDLLYKVMVWPLIAACSFKVKFRHDEFKPEYIVPQLLMQWVNKDSTKIAGHSFDGIAYSSAHIDENILFHKGKFINYALPVKSTSSKGYCHELLKKFHSTEVVPLELRQFLSQSSNLWDQETISYDVNENVFELDLLGNKQSQRYSDTAFGLLEHTLKDLPLGPIIKKRKFTFKG